MAKVKETTAQYSSVYLSEGSERCEKGEDGGEGSSVAPGEIVVVGIQEVVAAPAVYGEDLTNTFFYKVLNIFPKYFHSTYRH